MTNALSIALQNDSPLVLLTPMRNELRTIQNTLDSVLSQTLCPRLWLILDDGSTDGCSDIVDRHCQQHPWIVRVALRDRGYDFVGQGVAQLLNHGVELFTGVNYEYLLKLDADMSFSADYFAQLVARMENDSRLGLASGHPYVLKNGKPHFERHSYFFPSGTARIYRASALRNILPFVNSVGWDTVDILRMQMKGYKTRVFSDLPTHHMRPMGTRSGYIDGMVRDGRNAYLTGYSPLFFTARSLFNARYFPYLLRTCCMLFGYFRAMIRKMPTTVNHAEKTFHRRMQWARMIGKPSWN